MTSKILEIPGSPGVVHNFVIFVTKPGGSSNFLEFLPGAPFLPKRGTQGRARDWSVREKIRKLAPWLHFYLDVATRRGSAGHQKEKEEAFP